MAEKKVKKTTRKQHVAVTAAKHLRKHFCDHFVPHEGNNHVPHVLKHNVLLGYSVIILLLKVLVVVTPIMLPSASLYSGAVTASNVILLTNQTRINLGLGGLTQNAKLMAAAQAKAMDMLNNQYFAHNSPAGLTPWYFIKSQGYAYERAGENLAVHYTTAEGVHDGWLASPAHRANIVKEDFTEIGVGVAHGDFEGYPSTIVVQFFGRPKEVVVVDPEPVADMEDATQAESLPEIVTEAEPIQEPSETVQTNEKEVAAAVDLSNDENLPSAGESATDVAVIVNEVEPAKPPVVDVSELVIAPTEKEGVYDVKVAAKTAESVAVQMGSEWVDLKRNAEEEIWEGEVVESATSYNKNGESLQIIARDTDGVVTAQTAALVVPDASVQDFFVFSEGESKSIKLFGFLTLNNLDDKVKKFYVYMMIFLAAAIVLKVLIKIHVQRVSTIAHACFVIGLAFVMLLM